MFTERQQRARVLLAECQLDSLIFYSRENLRYLCGFTGSDGVLLIDNRSSFFLTDSRYTTQARAQVSADHIEEYRVQADGVMDVLRTADSRRIGFEPSLAYGKVSDLRKRGENFWDWVLLGEELERLRLLKSSAEIAAIEMATQLNAQAFEAVASLIRPGISERELALALEFELKHRGAEEKAFDFIVASGPRGALPHGVASDRPLQHGELVTIDFGCRIDGYHSDETVTLAIGEVPYRLRQAYDTVLRAHDQALAAVGPDVPLVELDRIARSGIESAGFGDFFGHGLGHGVGLEIHEAPNVSPRSQSVAKEGMVFTIEPGIYLPGLGGVRLEDMVLVTEKGARILTRISKQFRNLAT